MGDKTCSKCGERKPLTEFYRDKRHTDGLHSACKVCVRTRIAQHRIAHKDEINQRRREMYPQHAEKRRATVRAWNKKYPERARVSRHAQYEKNKERYKRQARKWLREHPEYRRAKARREGQRRRAAPGKHTPAEWAALRSFFGERCLACGATEQITADHVIPIAQGGSDGIENLQPLCNSCNASKGAAIADYRDPELLAAFLATLKLAA